MQSLFEVFSLYAELSLGLAGFTGVAAAFAGRERTFRSIELARIQGILTYAVSVLAGCLAFYTGTSLQLSEQASRSAVAIASCLVMLVLVLYIMPTAWRHHNDSDSTVTTRSLAVVSMMTVGLAGLQAFAATPWGRPWQIILGFSAQLLLGLWLFVRLLTRPN